MELSFPLAIFTSLRENIMNTIEEMVQQILYLNDMKPDVIVHSRTKLTAERFITLVFNKEINSYFSDLGYNSPSSILYRIRVKYFADFIGLSTSELQEVFYSYIGYRICIKCREILPLSSNYFYNISHTTTGFQTSCIACYDSHYKQYNSLNKEKRNNWYRQYYSIHKSIIRYSSNMWRRSNLQKDANKSARRRASKLQRTPKWADLDKIQAIYLSCKKGEHVDHIIPLQGELVSGLHVWNNLRCIPATDNLKKGNKYVIN